MEVIMQQKRNTWARVGSAVLAAMLMVVAVAKAQGCQRPVETDEPTAQSPQPEVAPQAEPAPVEERPAALTAPTAADAGTVDASAPVELPAPVIEDREVFPATKAGPVFRPTPNQQKAPK